MHVVRLTAEGSVFLCRIFLGGFRPEQNKDKTITKHRLGHKGNSFFILRWLQTQYTETGLLTLICACGQSLV